MKRVLLTFAALAAVAVSAPALANDALAKAKGCLACHTVDKKLVGPAYKDIAKKYAGDASAPAKLTEKVLKGGSGVWGPVPMTPNKITEAEAKQLVTWVLSLK
ncbi:MAG: c-type cytochrome [Burkholderiaceae bacterium]|jgi:cytochrome c|nr:c-type cytochrome [Burkholderiaceae bacterium]